MKTIAPTIIEKSITYAEYRKLIDQLLEEGKTTSDDHSEAMLEYTKLNVSRMNRLDKTIRVSEESKEALSALDQKMLWLVITEGWCGDAAQIIPVLQKMADESPSVEMRLVMRDQHLDLMDAFLTNGARAIPKVIFVNPSTREVMGAWGPRPEPAQTMMMNTKKELKNITVAEIRDQRALESKTALHSWYARDKSKTTQQEFLAALQNVEQVN